MNREHRTLAITAILAVGAPVGAASWIASRTDELATQLGTAGGVPATIGTVDADLSGAVRLSDVAFGAAIGIVSGRTVTIGRGENRFALAPMAAPGGGGVSFTWVGNR